MVLSIDAYKDWMIWMERENALPRICFMNNDGKYEIVAFDEEAYSLGVSASPEFDTNDIPLYLFITHHTIAHL